MTAVQAFIGCAGFALFLMGCLAVAEVVERRRREARAAERLRQFTREPGARSQAIRSVNLLELVGGRTEEMLDEHLIAWTESQDPPILRYYGDNRQN